MGKTHRGKGIEEVNKGIGNCPICKRTRIKVIYEVNNKEGKSVKVCKQCRQRARES